MFSQAVALALSLSKLSGALSQSLTGWEEDMATGKSAGEGGGG